MKKVLKIDYSLGKGAIYSYDAVGSYEKLKYGAQGSSNSAMTAALDNMVAHKNRNDPKIPITLQDAIDIVKDVCLSATEVNKLLLQIGRYLFR